MLSGITQYILKWAITNVDAPPCECELHCGVWLSGLHDTMPWYNWPDQLSFSFDFSDCFFYSLTFIFCTTLVRKWKTEFKTQEEKNRKAFYSILGRESVSLETLRATFWSLDSDVVSFQPRLTWCLFFPGDHFTPHFKYAAVASPVRSVNKRGQQRSSFRDDLA